MKRGLRRLLIRALDNIWCRRHTLWCRYCRWRERRAIRAYRRRWPKFCRDCGGWGGWSIAGGYDSPPDYDACDVFEDERTCHRCGHPGLTEDDAEGPCAFCGWNYDDGCPEVEPYCGCDFRLDERMGLL